MSAVEAEREQGPDLIAVSETEAATASAAAHRERFDILDLMIVVHGEATRRQETYDLLVATGSRGRSEADEREIRMWFAAATALEMIHMAQVAFPEAPADRFKEWLWVCRAYPDAFDEFAGRQRERKAKADAYRKSGGNKP